MSINSNEVKNENSKKSFKWIIGIVLAIALLGGGGYLIYRFWPKKPSEQFQQGQEEEKNSDTLKKEKLRWQIKLIRDKIAEGKIALEKKKSGQQYKFNPFFDELPEKIVFSNPDKESQELQKEKNEVLKEYEKLQGEIESSILQQEQKNEQTTENKPLADWNKQKNNQWIVLTEKLNRDPAIKAKFDQFITTFYHRYKDSKKDSIPTHPAVDFRGFAGFYVDAKAGFLTEMGNTGLPEDYGGRVQTKPSIIIEDYPLQIKLNQLYLLNNGRNPGGAMDKLYSQEPIKEIRWLDINFDKLRRTIAHEIAHAFQNAKNLSEDKAIVGSGDGVGFVMLSDCMESGGGERDKEHNLVKPENPELVYEHKKFENEIDEMILASTEYKEFERWWKATS